MRRSCSLLVVVLLATACGGVAEEATERLAEAGGGDVEVDLDDGSVSVSFDDGETSFQGGSNVDVPDELTFPIPDGGNVTSAAVQGSYVAVGVQYSQDRFDELATFFDEWTSSDDSDWQRSESTTDMGDATVRNVTWNAGAELISINDCIGIDALSGGDADFNAVCLSLNEDL